MLGTFVAGLLDVDHAAGIELGVLHRGWVVLAVGFAVVGPAPANGGYRGRR